MFVFDLETDTLRTDWPQAATFADATQLMHVTVICGWWGGLPDRPLIRPPHPDQCTVYWRHGAQRHDLDRLASDMDQARMLVAYNGDRFDLQVLRKYYPDQQWRAWREKLFDPFQSMHDSLQSMVSLQELTRYNALGDKRENSLDAPSLWRTGQHVRLEKYCRQDVYLLVRVLYHPRGRVVVPRKHFRDVLDTVSFPLLEHTLGRWRMITKGQGAGEKESESGDQCSAAYREAVSRTPFATVPQLHSARKASHSDY